jgi:hypothetical protein
MKKCACTRCLWQRWSDRSRVLDHLLLPVEKYAQSIANVACDRPLLLFPLQCSDHVMSGPPITHHHHRHPHCAYCHRRLHHHLLSVIIRITTQEAYTESFSHVGCIVMYDIIYFLSGGVSIAYTFECLTDSFTSVRSSKAVTSCFSLEYSADLKFVFMSIEISATDLSNSVSVTN